MRSRQYVGGGIGVVGEADLMAAGIGGRVGARSRDRVVVVGEPAQERRGMVGRIDRVAGHPVDGQFLLATYLGDGPWNAHVFRELAGGPPQGLLAAAVAGAVHGVLVCVGVFCGVLLWFV